MSAARDWQDLVPPETHGKAEPVGNVIVPLDGTELSRVALPVGRVLARLYGATLHVAYVGEQAMRAQQTLHDLGLDPDELRGAVLDKLSGDPAEALLTAARELRSPLLVMCTHTGGHPESGDLGSVADKVLASVPTRIVLVPPERSLNGWRLRRILLGHDGSPSADAAIGPTTNLARLSKAEVLALHIAARRAAEADPGSLPAPRYNDQPQHEWPAWAREFVDRMAAVGAAPSTINFKLLVHGGQPGSEIAQFSRENSVSLVVVSWRGHWSREHCHTLRTIIRRSGCPVLLIHAHEAAFGEQRPG